MTSRLQPVLAILIAGAIPLATMGAAAELTASHEEPAEPIGPPTDVRAQPGPAEGTLLVEWEPPSTGANSVEGYRVYVAGAPVAETTSTTVLLEGIQATDPIWITAFSNDAESPPSEPLLAIANPCVHLLIGHIPPVAVDPGCVSTIQEAITGTTVHVEGV